MYSFLLLLCVWGTTVHSLSEEESIRITNFVEHVRRCRNIPSLTVGVANSEGTLLSDVFGLSDIEADTAPTAETLYPIGSTTKAFTTMVLAMIMQTGVGK